MAAVKILTPNNFPDYQLLDSGDFERLEKFGEYILIRPDPQIIWKKKLSSSEWQKADAKFEKSQGEKGKWMVRTKIPERWVMSYQDIKFYLKLSPFKHTGVFPEQEVHWNFIKNMLSNLKGDAKEGSRSNARILSVTEGEDGLRDTGAAGPHFQPNILNLFGYTGIASLVAAQSGAKVTHIDSSYPTIGWFKDNIKLSHLEDRPVRYIEDDVIKFCEREVKRGNKYDGIIMDPPIYGHGPGGEIWDFNKSFPKLLKLCQELLSIKPLFIIVNAYAISTSAITLNNTFYDYFQNLGGNIEFGELALKEQSEGRLLSTGIFARWSK